jgi:hypothetical protein
MNFSVFGSVHLIVPFFHFISKFTLLSIVSAECSLLALITILPTGLSDMSMRKWGGGGLKIKIRMKKQVYTCCTIFKQSSRWQSEPTRLPF